MDKKWVIVNVAGAIYKQDKWLMIERSLNEDHAPGRVSLVGGKVDERPDHEVPYLLEQTLKREIQEEVGIEVEDRIEYLTNTYFISDHGNPVINVVFLCKYKSGEPTLHNTDEVGEILWMTLDEILHHPKTITQIKEIMKKAVEKRVESFI